MATAAQKSGLSSPVLNGIALGIIDSQQQEIARMLEWRDAWYGSSTISPDAARDLGMSIATMGMANNMHFHGSNIDGHFAQAMTVHHEGAIRMAQIALGRARHPEIKRLARQIIAAQRREVQKMKPLSGGSGDQTMTDMSMG
jgi:uncharacterized protein (DUF305 family)